MDPDNVEIYSMNMNKVRKSKRGPGFKVNRPFWHIFTYEETAFREDRRVSHEEVYCWQKNSTFCRPRLIWHICRSGNVSVSVEKRGDWRLRIFSLSGGKQKTSSYWNNKETYNVLYDRHSVLGRKKYVLLYSLHLPYGSQWTEAEEVRPAVKLTGSLPTTKIKIYVTKMSEDFLVKRFKSVGVSAKRIWIVDGGRVGPGNGIKFGRRRNQETPLVWTKPQIQDKLRPNVIASLQVQL